MSRNNQPGQLNCQGDPSTLSRIRIAPVSTYLLKPQSVKSTYVNSIHSLCKIGELPQYYEYLHMGALSDRWLATSSLSSGKYDSYQKQTE